MESVKKICKFCPKTVIENNFEIVEDVVKEVLDVLSQNVNFDPTTSVICRSCWKKSLAAFQFKATCLYTEDVIFPYIDGAEVSQLDLKEIYMQGNRNKIRPDNVDEKVCRLCMQLVTGQVKLLVDMEFDVLKKFLPEMNFDIIKDPVICKVCCDSFDSHYEFLKNFLWIGKRIDDLTLQQIANKLDCDGNVTRIKSTVKVKQKSERDSSVFHEIKRKNLYDPKWFQCNLCSYKTKHKPSVFRHQSVHTNPPKVKPVRELQFHKCDKCAYGTHRMHHFIRHQLVHKDPSEVHMYKCPLCNFETKHKYIVTRHQLMHMKPSEIQFYECDKCDFKAKERSKLREHQVIHKDPSEVPMYKCNECGFETKHRVSLKTHLGKHDKSKINTYKCHTCPYVTWSKALLKKHQIKHSDLRMYECDECEYKAKTQSRLTTHKLVHKDPSEVKMYKCNECDFQTRIKTNLEYHQLRHKNSGEVQMYKCDECSFRTKHKISLQGHRRRHEKVLKYNCDKCHFKTDCTRWWKSHRLIHELSSKIYRCHSCDYITGNKSNMENHQRRHRKRAQKYK